MITERRGDRQSRSQRATQRVNQYRNRLLAILGKHEVHIVAVEVSTTDEAFEMKIVESVIHSISSIRIITMQIYI